MSGKGSSPRPIAVSNEEYANRWDAIFGRASDAAKKEEHSLFADTECAHPVWGYEYTTEMYFCTSCGLKAKHPSQPHQ